MTTLGSSQHRESSDQAAAEPERAWRRNTSATVGVHSDSRAAPHGRPACTSEITASMVDLPPRYFSGVVTRT